MPEEVAVDTRHVIVPVRRDRKGFVVETRRLELPWECPECGGPRGMPTLTKPQALLSLPKYRRLPFHTWINPCGHKEPDVYAE